jgi:CRISPR system Cascade subunit CasC
MFIELHLIQNFAPSNLNRDDTGTPKDCIFGGVRRARISSQCLKRAMRAAPVFAKTTRLDNAVRTKQLIQEKLKKGLPEEKAASAEAEAILTKMVEGLFSKMDKAKTAVLLYISPQEAANICETVVHNWDALIDPKGRDGTIAQLVKELNKQFRDRTSAPDIALFGRMLAEHPDLNIDAACQVAHALSTHRISMEMDFYTAVDELNKDDSGAGMMGFTGYDSACFYRYARLDYAQLHQNLGAVSDVTHRTVEGFLRATIDAIPTGKQNSFAAHNPPSLIMAVVRNGGMGWSLANAFERPVPIDRNGGYVAASVRSLDDYWQRLCTVYGESTLARVAVLPLDADLPLSKLTSHQVQNLDDLIKSILDTVTDKGGTA